jgi:hypothetical protein
MITLRRPRVLPKAVDIPERSEPSTPTYEAWLQGVGNGHVLGWCWNPVNPKERVQITIVVDGEIVAEGTADVPRPDLSEHGDGAHGFLVPLPDSLKTPGRRRVLAFAGPTRAPITTAPSFWYEAASDNGWGDVVFEPGEHLPSGVLPAKVPKPPTSENRHAVHHKGWLFDAREFEPSLAPTPTDLDAILTSLTTTAVTCADLGISYLPVIIPAKRRVVRATPPLDRSSIAELQARLRDIDEVELLDLLPVLRDADRHGPPYHRNDADWNDRGAFFVARALLKEAHKLVPALRPGALADLHLRPILGYCGTLADASKLELVDDELIQCELEVEAEDGVVINAHELRALRMPVESHLAELGSVHLRVYATPESEEEARIAVVGDAASLPIVRWLAERTRRTTFFWSHTLPLTQLELELPPIAIHLIREADLCSRQKRLWHEAPGMNGTAH